MTRKKSRPTHRENAAAVPSNEGGFYKMFWNSMDTNPGTNGTNSPSQGEAPVTSPPVIITSDSEGSPCAHDENSCENLVVPLPIKEEIRESAVMSPNQHSSAETSSNFQDQESHSATNGEDSSHQTCLPGNPLTSPSKNSPPSPPPHTDLNSPQNPPQTCEYSNPISTCVDSTVSEISSHEPTEVPFSSDQPQETPCRAEEDGGPMKTAEDTQAEVCGQVTTEELVDVVPESNLQLQPNFSKVENSTVSEEISCNNTVISNQTKHLFEDSDDAVADQNIFHASPVHEGILAVTPTHSFDPPDEPNAPFSELQSVGCVSGTTEMETPQEMSGEKPMELDSEPQTPAVGQVNCETTPHELPSLILLRSLLNARDEDLEDLNLDEALAELPGLIGEHNDPPEQNSQNEGEMVCFESGQESSLPSDINVSGMDVDQNTTLPENIPSTETMTPDVSETYQSNEMAVEKDEEFPIFNNFLPLKIKLDAIGILRSVKVLKDSVRSLYKEYLKEDVILRTVSTSEPPAEKDDESADEVEETPSFPPVNVYPKICCVKMERLPDPFVKKSTITMSDDTFKTWKKQIIRQRNEEKFRYLKVWRRGRTLLWRECELAGMDRATYDEQVAYVKKHKLNENSSSDSGSSDDESEGGASDRNCDSSEESYSDLENEDSEGELSSLPSLTSPTKQTNSENQSISSLHMTSGIPTEVRLSEDEYVIERTSSTNQSSENKAPSALKITIRKASTSKSEEDKEKPEEENFPVPVQPTVKSRKIATKRTYRRPSDPIPKASVLPKLGAADTKKSKNTPVEDEYDQSLLGTRSYEVENFNLLEKWDIPFEEPTLFRSPRAASKLAQLKTKEAFQPHKKHALVKAAAATTSSGSATFTTTPTTTTDVTTNTVSKAVKDVVEMLCAKTVEAMLFPESKSANTKKPTETEVDSVNLKDFTNQIQPSEGPSKSLVPSEETSYFFDESSEMSQSETNSTLDASSDFDGSTASLASEDFPAPQNKSPKKPRRRRPRFGPAWGKKKKVKTKAAYDQPVEKENSKNDERSAKDANESSLHSTEKPVAENVIQVKGKPTQEVGASPVHSTQVPVVSEGPGQSPYESEDDSAHRCKEPVSRNDSNRKTSESSKETQPNDVIRSGEIPLEEPKPNKKAQEEAVPRLTRSKQPTVFLDPELLENFGTRKRKPRTHVVEDVSHGENAKKSKLEVTENTPQKSKAQTIKPSIIDSKETSSPLDKVVNDDSNTQVPEVSEGPGDVGLDHESKPDQLNKVEVNIMMLRSRSRGPGPRPTESAISPVKHSTEDNQKTDKTSQAEEDDPADKNQSEEPLVLESPASPPPEPEISSRITRSKRRSGPAYVAVKSTAADALPSVCDIVDSIARHRLPTPSKLFDAVTPVTSNLSTEPGKTPNVDPTSFIDGKVLTSSSSELGPQPTVVHSESLSDKSVQPPTIEGTCQGSTLEQPVKSNIVPATKIMDSEGSSIVPVPKSVTNTSLEVADKTSKLSNNLIGADAPCGFTDKSKSPAAVEVGLSTVAVEEDTSSGIGSPSSGLALEKPVTEEVECGRLEVLDTLNSILAVTSPKKTRYKVSTAGPLLPPPLSSSNLQTTTVMNASISQPPVSNISAIPTINSTPLPGYLSSTQDMNNILPGTFLNSFLNSTLDANLTTFSNETNDSASLADDPDGDLVIDEGEVPDVNFWENLTNADLDKNDNSADFSDDDNNTDLADKIDQIVKDQIHQDPVPVPSLKSKEASASLGDGSQKVLDETSPSKSVLNRRDSIDERTGLPTNFIQRLRDPRIRSRLLSQLEEEEATGKTQSALAPLLNSLPASNLTSSTVAVPQANKVGINGPRRRADEVAVVSSSSSTGIPCMNVQVITQPVMGAQFETVGSTMPGQPTNLVLPITPALATPLVASGTLVAHGSTVLPVEDSGKPEEPPDPSKVDFVVPPSDDEEEEAESIKRRPKKAKKQVDVELMYKSPLEDLQSEARSGYGERAPRRYADNFPRRRSGDDRSARWDDRRSRDDRRFEDRGRSQSRDRRFEDRGRSQSRDQRFEGRGRSRSRDRRFEDRGRSRSRDGRFDDGRDRSRSRDRRAFYDRPRDQSRDRRAYDPYPGREDPESTPHHMDHMQVPYNQSPWPVSTAIHNHQMVMPSPRWQPNYYPEPHVPHPPIFVPEPPKIDFMETRLINLELLPKTTNLEISPIRKVFSYFDKDSVQVMNIPPPTYDPNDQPHTIKMMDPVTEEMVDFIQTPRPTSGLTKDIFKHVPPHLNLDDVVKFHFIHPSYVMVQDNDEDPLSSSDEEDDKLEAKENTPSHDREQDSKPLQHKKRVSKPLLEHHQKQQRKPADEQLQKEGGELSIQHHSKGEHELISGNRLHQENTPKIVREDTPLQNLLQNLPLLQQFSLHQYQPPIPTPPPAPEWNDVDLRMSRELALEEVPSIAERSPLPLKERSKKRSRSRSKSPKSTSLKSPSESSRSTSRRSRSKSPRSTSLRSPSESSRSTSRRSRSKTPRSTSHRSRSKSPRSTSRRSRSKSPRSTSHRSRRSSPRRRRSRSRSRSQSDMSISPTRSRSRSPSYSRRGSKTSRRRRSRSRSSERSRTSRSKRSRSPKRHSTSISPSRKHRR